MAKPALYLVLDYMSHIAHLEKTRNKMDMLLEQDIIVRRDIEHIYSGLYLEAICSLEQLIENLFIGLLVRRITHKSQKVLPRVYLSSDIVARDIVFGGQKYVDWFPYNRTEERAKAFFRNGMPFTNLANHKNKLELLLCIRNAIAHKSSHSKKMFEQKVIGNTPLMPRERTPAGYLRSIFRSAPRQTRYEDAIMNMIYLAAALCDDG